MAVTGFFMFLFVLGHLAGNLQVFGGPEMINRYGHFLQSNLELVWPARIILLIFLGLHIWSAIVISLENRAAHERTLRLPVPSLDTRAFLKLMQLDLAAHPPGAPVVQFPVDGQVRFWPGMGWKTP